MLELLQSGGWLMPPLALAGVVALAACVERTGGARRGSASRPEPTRAA